jgi:inositol transport system substrate-binding protein
MMHGYPEQAAELKRTQGAVEMLQRDNGLRLLAEQTATWSREEGIALMALEAAGVKDQIVLVSVDAIADALQAVKAGRLDATAFQNARAQGATAVEVAVRILRGQSYPQHTLIPFELVPRANVDRYLDPEVAATTDQRIWRITEETLLRAVPQ